MEKAKQHYDAVILAQELCGSVVDRKRAKLRWFDSPSTIIGRCLNRAINERKIKPCFWVYLKNNHNHFHEGYNTYYEIVMRVFEKRHNKKMKKAFRIIKMLKYFNTQMEGVKSLNNKYIYRIYRHKDNKLRGKKKFLEKRKRNK